MMPTMNGYQVCRELKGNADTSSIPILMLTAKSQESDKFWGKEAGADGYVTKPFDMEELMEKIGGLLDD
jgi:DNA-binding response OmpR family regulator